MRLSELKTGSSATILKVVGHGGFRRRIVEMGFIRGQRVEVVLNAPLKDPIEYRVMGYQVSLRRSEAEMVVVLTDEEAERLLATEKEQNYYAEESASSSIDEVVARQSRTISVALVGNPNSGKTSLFNAISGGHEHVGNYSGVTVGAKSGVRIYGGYRFEITDLPGTYALSAYSPEERFVREHIARQTPDVVINSVVASNLERNLYLTTELIDINPRMVVALNMYDELQASGARLDYDSLGRMMGVPMVPVEARNRRGIEELLDTVIAIYENRDDRVRHIHINQGAVLEESLQRLNADLAAHRSELPKAFPPRYYAMKMLEGDRQVEEMLSGCSSYGAWSALRDREVKRIEQALHEDVETAFANQKYGFISGALKETYTPGHHNTEQIEPRHHPSCRRGEEGRREQNKHRQSRTARHKGDDQDRYQSTRTALDRAAGHNGGDIASKAHNEGNKRLTVQTRAMHDTVHNKGRACQVARILHKGNKEIEDHNIGQEDNHRSHTANDAINHQIAQYTFGQ